MMPTVTILSFDLIVDDDYLGYVPRGTMYLDNGWILVCLTSLFVGLLSDLRYKLSSKYWDSGYCWMAELTTTQCCGFGCWKACNNSVVKS